jgi:hypothetical protein
MLMRRRFHRLSRRTVVLAAVCLAFAAAAGVGLAQITSGSSPTSATRADAHDQSSELSGSAVATTTETEVVETEAVETEAVETDVESGDDASGARTSTTTGHGQEKVTICHKTGSTKHPGHTIVVAQPAVAAHIAHGDSPGACAPAAPTPVTPTAAVPHATKPKKPKSHGSHAQQHGHAAGHGHSGHGAHGHAHGLGK